MRHHLSNFEYIKEQLKDFVYDPSKHWSEYPCMLWDRGVLDKDGYAGIAADGKFVRAHRLAFEITRGPIPKGLVSDHLCRTRNCWQPAHIDPVTCAENSRRGNTGKHQRRKRRTHCKRGHELTTKNTYEINGKRRCRECQRERDRAYYTKHLEHCRAKGRAKEQRKRDREKLINKIHLSLPLGKAS
jgi:hypothetical protein